MVSEDFSFPRMKNPLPHFAVSPSLWRVSSVVYPADVNWEHGWAEENMDKLWEDFNEELQRTSSSGNKNNNNNKKNKMSGGENEQQKLHLCSVQAPNSGPLIQQKNKKKQSYGSVMKIFKSIFSIKKSIQKNMKN